jgi:hypothetical protein
MTSQNRPTSFKQPPTPSADQHAVSVQRAVEAAKKAEEEAAKRKAAAEALEKAKLEAEAGPPTPTPVPPEPLSSGRRYGASKEPVEPPSAFVQVAQSEGIDVKAAYVEDLSGMLLVCAGQKGSSSIFVPCPMNTKLPAHPVPLELVVEEKGLRLFAAQVTALGGVLMVTQRGDELSSAFAPKAA